MFCPYCGSEEIKVVDKRDTEEGKVIRRRRECLKCKERFTTYEKIRLDLKVKKRDGKKEKFDKDKLKNGIKKACEKRPISIRTIERLANEVEEEIKRLNEAEIDSSKIGNIVMKKLKALDHVAYVRFASYYKDFKNVRAFKKSLR